MNKNKIILLAIAALIFAGCGNKSSEHSHDGEDTHEHTDGTHEHENGAAHEDHQDSEHSQEEFKVESDSTLIKMNEHNHKDSSHPH